MRAARLPRAMWCWEAHSSNGGADSDDDDDCLSEDTILGTAVPEGLFAPPEPMSRSGGTASFFRVRYIAVYRDPRYARGDDFWIGKDLARAADELKFYEQAQHLDASYQLLHRWGMAYGGVYEARCVEDDDGTLEVEPRQLLLLENLRFGTKKIRMLDVKLGEETAVGGWKGKSKQAAARNRVIDRMTNSKVQGFRLEGFDNQPATLRSQATAPPTGCVSLSKRSRRFKLQRLRAQEFLGFWLENTELAEAELGVGDRLLPIEYSECLLFDLVRKLATLCVDAARMPVPQMWIGSSLAVCCEGGELPDRHAAFAALSSPEVHRGGLTRLKVFDWGRSELNTPAAEAKMGEEERQMRQHYWEIWQRGALRVLYDCVRLYKTQYCGLLGQQRREIWLKAWDYDTLDANDLIGVASIPLAPTRGPKKIRLRRAERSGPKLKAEVVVEVLELPLPHGRSRLAQAWRVLVHSVHNLPRMDVFSATDPLIVVELAAPGCEGLPRASTPVVWNDQNATFDAPLDFAVSTPATVASFFSELSRALGQHVDPSWFKLDPPPENAWTVSGGCEEGPCGPHDGFEDFLAKVGFFSQLARGRSSNAMGGQPSGEEV